MANRGALAVAERLGTAAVTFPSYHGGFLGGEYGHAGDPDAFAARLREVLAGPDDRSGGGQLSASAGALGSAAPSTSSPRSAFVSAWTLAAWVRRSVT